MNKDILNKFKQSLVGIKEFNPKRKCVVAVSGGADSMATVFMCKEMGLDICAVIVNHGYRKESKKEADAVKKILDKNGIENYILTNDKKIPNSNVESFLREVRFELLEKFCTEHKISQIIFGHHSDDQVETFLMRLERGAFIDGLSGIKKYNKYKNINLFRPLISEFSKNDLENYLTRKKIKWFFDKSNNNLKFKRNYFRDILNKSKNYEEIKKIILNNVNYFSRVSDYLNIETKNAINKCCEYSDLGYIKLNLKEYYLLHEEIKLRILKLIINNISSKDIPTRFENVISVFNLISENNINNFSGATSHGVELIKKKNNIYFIKELSKIKNKEINLNKKNIMNIEYERNYLFNFKNSKIKNQKININYLGKDRFNKLIKLAKNKNNDRLNNLINNIPKKIFWAIPCMEIINIKNNNKIINKLNNFNANTSVDGIENIVFVPHIYENSKILNFEYSFDLKNDVLKNLKQIDN